MRIGASALYSEVRPGDDRRLYNDNTRTDSFEIRGSIVPLQSQRSTLTLTAAAGFSNVSESDVFGPIYNDHIRTVSLTSDYRLQDNFGGNNYFTLTWRQGLDILGASHMGDDFLSRDGASGNFSVMDVWFTRYQTLSDAWSVKIAAAGQIASGPLFTSQQFYLGGAAFGRGYGSAEISGDNGIAGSLELRFDQKLNFRYLTGYQLYGFVDAGAAWNDGYSYTDGLVAHLRRRRRAVFSGWRSAGRHRGGLPAELPRARQLKPQRAPAVLVVQRLQALSGKSADALPLGQPELPRAPPAPPPFNFTEQKFQGEHNLPPPTPRPPKGKKKKDRLMLIGAAALRSLRIKSRPPARPLPLPLVSFSPHARGGNIQYGAYGFRAMGEAAAAPPT